MNILSIQTGKPQWRPADEHGPTWETATFKAAVNGPVHVNELGIEGDGHADQQNHGGPDKAMLCYAAAHYPLWRQELGIPEFTNGALGENLTVECIGETEVCLGDRYQIGDVLVEVSQPRKPCWKQARRFRIQNMVVLMRNSGRTGWYVRVLNGGTLEPGLQGQLIARPHPDWTIARASEVMYLHKDNPDLSRALAEVPTLAESWKSELQTRF